MSLVPMDRRAIVVLCFRCCGCFWQRTERSVHSVTMHVHGRAGVTHMHIGITLRSHFGQGGFCFFPTHPGFPDRSRSAAQRGCDQGRSWLAGFRPVWSVTRPWSCGRASLHFYRRRWPSIRASPTKKEDVRRWRRWAGGCACTSACLSQFCAEVH